MEPYLLKIIIAALLASISCGIAGSYLVARRLVFIGGGITHASFGGIGLGFFWGINPIYTALIFAVAASVGVEAVAQRGKIREDTIIAVLWSLGMAIGIFFMTMTQGYTPSLITFLFGNITSVGWMDIISLTVVSVCLIALLYFFFYPLLFQAFDLSFLRASKRNTQWINYIAMGLVGGVMVLNVRTVGVVLLMSMLTIPQMTVGLFSKTFKGLIVGSILLSLIGTLGGVTVAWHYSLPSGVSIVLSQVTLFSIAWIYSKIRKQLLFKKSIRNDFNIQDSSTSLEL